MATTDKGSPGAARSEGTPEAASSPLQRRALPQEGRCQRCTSSPSRQRLQVQRPNQQHIAPEAASAEAQPAALRARGCKCRAQLATMVVAGWLGGGAEVGIVNAHCVVVVESMVSLPATTPALRRACHRRTILENDPKPARTASHSENGTSPTGVALVSILCRSSRTVQETHPWMDRKLRRRCAAVGEAHLGSTIRCGAQGIEKYKC